MATFHALRVLEVVRETADSVVVSLDVPSNLHEAFRFDSGQYLTLRATVEGQDIRRSYSLCSAPGEQAWKVGIKKVPGGKFSTFANDVLKAGDSLEVMEPQGRFTLKGGEGLHHVGMAAGSGITPILSHVKDVLTSDPSSTYTLFYSNKTAASTMFREELQDLKDRHLGRLRLFYLLTREPVDAELLSGRLDRDRCAGLLKQFCSGRRVDAAYLCGPEAMILSCKEALLAHGVAEEDVRIELFTTAGSAGKKETGAVADDATGGTVAMQVVLDGVTTSVDLPRDRNMLDAALDAGLDAPYSCLGGVCCTCRAKLVQGKATMNVNYALEPGEVERGYVLSCQAHVEGDGPVVLDFDQQ
jgi:ring-1,2-phenylacetyl-CoA epoxidase subunit PaaE